MKFSTRSTYGLRAMIALANRQDSKSISLSSIAKAENISQGYLESIFSKLKKAKLVESEKGATGGYKLAKNSNNISAYDIIKALEGESPMFYCLDKREKIYCNKKCQCGVTTVLTKVRTAVDSALKKIKLNKLCSTQNK